jgi:16S rRNA processing protein RimM
LNKKNFIKIGKVTKHHGIKGYAKFYYYGDINDFQYKEVFLNTEGKLLSYFIEDWYLYKKFIIIKLENINSINDINEKIKGCEVYIERSQLIELSEDEFYWHQLIGLSVFDVENNYIGTLKKIIETGSNDVFVVENKEEEILIPYIDSVVRNIDLEQGKMEVLLLEEV